MPEPLPIPKDNIARALKRAEHYRLLNEPAQAESICLDIVAVDPANEDAWIHLLLSLTDQFADEMTHALEQAKTALEHVQDEYLKVYYKGMIHERWGRANLRSGHSPRAVETWIRQAMQCYRSAMDMAPAEDPDPMLRWNTCARLLNKISSEATAVQPAARRDMHSEYEEVPRRNLK